MERGLDLSNPDELMHDIHITLHGDDENERKANLWAYIAAYAHTVGYDYERVLHFIEFVNAYQLMCFYSDKWTNLPSPDPIEYLEILEFIADSLRLAVNDSKATWEWPNDWGHVRWNCNISSSFSRHWNEPWAKTIVQVEEAIVLHKNKYGHRQPLRLSVTEKLLISEMLNLFVPMFEEIPPLSPILLSLDKPPGGMSIIDNIAIWDTDRLLGEYLPGELCEIVIYERGLRDCSRELGLPKLALRELTIVHELAHWAADQIPLSRSRSISNHERWSDGGSTSGLEVTEIEVHEGWAQLLTFYTLLMAYDDRLRNSVAHPSLSTYAKRDGRGCVYTFLELNEHQSTAYWVWKDILAFGKTPQQVIGTLKELRLALPGATISKWKSIIAVL